MGSFRKPLLMLLFTLPVLIVITMYLRVTGSAMAVYFLDVTLVLHGLFIALALIDIYRLKTMKPSEKWMYRIAVIFLGPLGGVLYILRPQKKPFIPGSDIIPGR